MAIAPTAGAAGDSGGSQVSSQTITVPTGILGGDVVFVWSICVPISAVTATITASSTGTTPVAVPGGSQSGTEPLPATVTGTLFSFVAAGATGGASTDVGKVITLTFSTTGFGSQVLQGYSGVNTSSPADVIGAAFGGASTASVTCPVKTTGADGDWALFFGGGAAEGGASLAIPAGSTSRRSDFSGVDVAASLADSNGSVGLTGTSIGGGTFTAGGASNTILVAVTMGLASASVAPVIPTAVAPRLAIPHPRLVDLLLEEAVQRADWQAQGFADLTVTFASTSGGVDTYNVLSPYNGGVTQQMRVLRPTAPNPAYPHALLMLLPVDSNQTTTFGDSIGTVQSLGAHNAYNLTCIQPGYAGVGGGLEGPWYADNPLNQAIYYETYTLLVAAWIRKNLATAGGERTYLIGFSRSGLGAQGLLFRHPDLFAAAASWDSPLMMTDYDGTDPTAGTTIGGNPAFFYGTSANFKTRYELDTHLAGWQATGQYGVNRIWLGLGPAFGADVPAYDAALTAVGIPHTYTFKNTVESHAWQTDWVAAALAAIVPSSYAASPVLPQRIPHPLFTQLLEVAAYRTDGVPAAAATITGTAAAAAAGSVTAAVTQLTQGSPAGAAAVTAAATQIAPGTAAGAGAATALAAQAATAATAGAAAVADAVTQIAGAAAAGAGSVTAAASGGGTSTASSAGAGSVTAVVTQIATAAAAGAGVITAAGQITGAASIAGAAAATAKAVQAATASPAGAAVLTALAAQQATAAIAGAGSVTAAGGLHAAFTVGTLTASDAAGGAGGVLTASDQRTGGPG